MSETGSNIDESQTNMKSDEVDQSNSNTTDIRSGQLLNSSEQLFKTIWYDDSEEETSLAQNISVDPFHPEAIISIRYLAPALELHTVFNEFVKNSMPYIIPELRSIFEQKLATTIRTNICTKRNLTRYYTIYEDDVIGEVNDMLKYAMQRGCTFIPSDQTISYMLDGYPINLLSNVCDVKSCYAHTIGEATRKFIIVRNSQPQFLPSALYNVIEGKCPLTGYPDSPLTKDELEALYRYLGTRKSIYVNILLNCLCELKYCDNLIESAFLTEDELISLCQSSWLFLFLWAFYQIDDDHQTSNLYENSDTNYEDRVNISNIGPSEPVFEHDPIEDNSESSNYCLSMFDDIGSYAWEAYCIFMKPTDGQEA